MNTKKKSNEKLREFLLFMQEKTKIKSIELIEKDFYLNMLLSNLNLEEYIFKGGTCLTKVYLNYHRLSEDLDFTFRDQKLFSGKSTKQIKKICKEKIDEFGKQLLKSELDFFLDKSNKRYVEIGSNNKLVTFKLWYYSLFTAISSFVKIQINFLDAIYFPVKRKTIISLLNKKIPVEEAIYFGKFLEVYKEKKIFVYNIKEIVAEKIRSLLTRLSIKSKDIVDLYFIYKRFKIKPECLIKESKEKMIFAMDKYKKYKEDFALIKKKIQDFKVSYNEIKELVIEKVEEEDFDKFVLNLKDTLHKLTSGL